jgi:hypothetical protein
VASPVYMNPITKMPEGQIVLGGNCDTVTLYHRAGIGIFFRGKQLSRFGDRRWVVVGGRRRLALAILWPAL